MDTVIKIISQGVDEKLKVWENYNLDKGVTYFSSFSQWVKINLKETLNKKYQAIAMRNAEYNKDGFYQLNP